jgi:hypothetical protein
MATAPPPESEPNQGATGSVSAQEAATAAERGDGPPPNNLGPTGADPLVNQGAPGGAPPTATESPLSVDHEHDTFAEHPELFVGAAFAGGFLVAQILKRFGR